ncbi:MAG: hypothetical protein GF350_16150 [Chitinivibrionales bacterium]|nr:hypothetical protein [Chitinivibrionales bacterium]
MLKEMVLLWKGNSVMEKAIDTFHTMLGDCHILFEKAWNVYAGKMDIENHSDDIHSRDKSINEKEREIRRLLVEHLTLKPGTDSSGCLALMSMVKDAERIGDYSKNIYDLSSMSGGRTCGLTHADTIEKIRDAIALSLGELQQAFKASNEHMAKRILDRYIATKPLCKEIVKNIYSEEISRQDALVCILLTQYLKRINSHVGNVASGIIFPLDKIDFVRAGLLD